MKKKFLLLLILCRSLPGLFAQSVSINTDGSPPHPSAMLDIKNTAKGILIPRMSSGEKNAITTPLKGLLVFDNDTGSFWYYNGTVWTELSTAASWGLTGNTGTNPSTHFIGTRDATALRFRINNINAGFIDSASNSTGIGFRTLESATTGVWNAAFGYKALTADTEGSFNTAVGGNALRLNTDGNNNTANGYAAMFSNASGYDNTASGAFALYYNTTGNANVAIGKSALFLNTTGGGNTAVGAYSMNFNTTGEANTAIGNAALYSNTTGSINTAIGNAALFDNTTGFSNTATGDIALRFNTTGNHNTATGNSTLRDNTTGYNNTAIGSGAMAFNTTGYYNTATGLNALSDNSTGSDNTANGVQALRTNTTGNRNTAMGYLALQHNTTGAYNIGVGYNAGTFPGMPFNNTISIGNNDYLNAASNQAFIGNLSTAWIGGNVGWSTFSDARTKVNVQDDVKGLDFIVRLRPVTYFRKIDLIADLAGNKSTTDFPEKYEIEKIKFSGFLAQEVDQAARDAGYDFNGITRPKNENGLYSLSYESFVVPLVKAMQEQQKIIEQQGIHLKLLQQQYETLKTAYSFFEKKN